MLDEEKSEQERKDLLKAEQEKMRELLNIPQFQRFCLKLIQSCAIFDAAFISSSENFFRQGRRSVGLEVLNEIMTLDSHVSATMIAQLRKVKDDD